MIALLNGLEVEYAYEIIAPVPKIEDGYATSFVSAKTLLRKDANHSYTEQYNNATRGLSNCAVRRLSFFINRDAICNGLYAEYNLYFVSTVIYTAYCTFFDGAQLDVDADEFVVIAGSHDEALALAVELCEAPVQAVVKCYQPQFAGVEEF